MKWDWRGFCDEHGLAYNEHGKSTKRGNIYLECPWCQDGKELMGLSLTNGNFGCWRDGRHRGKNPTRLIAKLLKVPMSAAQALVGDAPKTPGSVSDLRSRLGRKRQEEETVAAQYVLPRGLLDYKDLADFPVERKRVYQYLRKRGFPEPRETMREFDLFYALSGKLAGRICFPIYEEGNLLGITGRYVGKHDFRYLTYPDGKALADQVYGETTDETDTMLVVEGPVDRVAAQERTPPGVDAVGTLGLGLNTGKLAKLNERASRARRVFVLADAGALGKAAKIAGRIVTAPARAVGMPQDVGDPAELDHKDYRRLIDRG